MTPDQLKKRTILIQGKNSKKSGAAISETRRGPNYVDLSADKTSTDIFDDFFEYDKEIAGLTPARLQFKEDDYALENNEILADNNINNYEAQSLNIVINPIIMDDNDDNVKDHVITSSNNKEDAVINSYIQCSFIMKDGKQCRRQAPKGGVTCSKHKKVISNDEE